MKLSSRRSFCTHHPLASTNPHSAPLEGYWSQYSTALRVADTPIQGGKTAAYSAQTCAYKLYSSSKQSWGQCVTLTDKRTNIQT
jgi:hypothetical protein